jgi:toxin YoeB
VVAAAWSVALKKTAQKDASKIRQAGLKSKVEAMLDQLERDPFYLPPPYEKLVADLTGMFSRRINLKHRLVYEVDSESRQVTVYRMFSHYGD